MANTEFKDFSINVKAKINDTTIAWLHKWANEIASQAARNTSTEGWSKSDRAQLRGSYQPVIDEAKGVAQIGSPLEMALWEEFGTGSHADTAKNGGRQGRQGWWVYSDEYKGNGGKVRTEAQAKAIEKADKKKKLHATDGRDPNYTLEKAFTVTKPKAIADLEKKLKEMDK